MPYRILFLSSLIFILHTMLKKKYHPKYYIKLSMVTSNSCPSEGRWMLTGLQRLFTVSSISRHLMTYHTPPRMTSKTCLLSPAWKPFHPPPSLSGEDGSTSVGDPVHLCKNCILSPLRRLFSHSMTFSFLIPIFPHDTAHSFPNFHLFFPFICPTLFPLRREQYFSSQG